MSLEAQQIKGVRANRERSRFSLTSLLVAFHVNFPHPTAAYDRQLFHVYRLFVIISIISIIMIFIIVISFQATKTNHNTKTHYKILNEHSALVPRPQSLVQRDHTVPESLISTHNYPLHWMHSIAIRLRNRKNRKCQHIVAHIFAKQKI